MMAKNFRRVISLILTFVMCFGMLNLNVLAAQTADGETIELGRYQDADGNYFYVTETYNRPNNNTKPNGYGNYQWNYSHSVSVTLETNECGYTTEHSHDGTSCKPCEDYHHDGCATVAGCGHQHSLGCFFGCDHDSACTATTCDEWEEACTTQHEHDADCLNGACTLTAHTHSEGCYTATWYVWKLEQNSDGDGDGDGNTGTGSYPLNENNFKGSRYFGWDTYTQGATLVDAELGGDVYGMITVQVNGVTLTKGSENTSVTNQLVYEKGVDISGIPAGYYISAYKIVCGGSNGKYKCNTDHVGNATDETVSMNEGKGSYHVSVSKASMGHSNTNAPSYWILIELSKDTNDSGEEVFYNVTYNYGDLAEELADQPETVDGTSYKINAEATILDPNAVAEQAANEMGYRFVEWEIVSVTGEHAYTDVVGDRLDPGATLTVTGNTVLKAIWEPIPVYTLTVKYLDATTREELETPYGPENMYEGDSYNTVPLKITIPGYSEGVWDPESDAEEGTIDGPKEVIYLYTKSATPTHTKGTITVTKETTGGTTPSTAIFTLEKWDGEKWVSTGKTATYAATMTFTDLDEGTYRVVETNAGLGERYALTVDYNGQGAEDATGIELTKSNVGDNGSTDVSDGEYKIANTYTYVPQETLGEITINKTNEFDYNEIDIPSNTTFTLMMGETEIASATYAQLVANGGSYTFENLEAGVYHVVESGAGLKGYELTTTYSVQTVELEETVADNGDKTVSTGAIAITNSYEYQPTEKLGTITLTKVFAGDLTAAPEGFDATFQLQKLNTETNEWENVGDPIGYSANMKFEGLYGGVYRVVETINGELTGYSVEIGDKVNVTLHQDDQTDGDIVVDDGTTTVTNTYTKDPDAADAIDVTISGTKTIAYGEGTTTHPGATFTFELVDGENVVGETSMTIPEGETSGSFSFTVTFTEEVEDKTYTIREKAVTDAGWEIDINEYTVTVNVTETENTEENKMELSAVVTYPGEGETVTIANEYTTPPPETTSVTVSKAWSTGYEDWTATFQLTMLVDGVWVDVEDQEQFTITGNDSVTIDGLTKLNGDGVEIDYSVREISVTDGTEAYDFENGVAVVPGGKLSSTVNGTSVINSFGETYTLTVKHVYVDGEGNEIDIVDPAVTTGLEPGAEYSTTSEEFDGYEYDKVHEDSDAVTGTMGTTEAGANKTVIYVYKKLFEIVNGPVTVTKIWTWDSVNQPAIPNNVTFTIYGGDFGTEGRSYTLYAPGTDTNALGALVAEPGTGEGNQIVWTYTFKNVDPDTGDLVDLPVKDRYGDPIQYTVTETAVGGTGLTGNKAELDDGTWTYTRNGMTMTNKWGVGADVELIKGATASVVGLGDTFTYTLTVDNVGDRDATNVVVYDNLNAVNGIEWADQEIEGVLELGYDDDGTWVGNTVVWYVGDLAKGARETITFQVKVSDTTTSGTRRNTAYVTWNDIDTNYDDDYEDVTVMAVEFFVRLDGVKIDNTDAAQRATGDYTGVLYDYASEILTVGEGESERPIDTNFQNWIFGSTNVPSGTTAEAYIPSYLNSRNAENNKANVPRNDEILGMLRTQALTGKKLTIEGEDITQDFLDTYDDPGVWTVEWYAIKNANDGSYHVDGVLVRNTGNDDDQSATGSLTISKTFSGVDALSDNMLFTVTGMGEVRYVNYRDIRLNGGSYTIPDLPVGEYTVTESNAGLTGYTLTVTANGVTNSSTATATVTEDAAGSVSFNNAYEAIPYVPPYTPPVTPPVTPPETPPEEPEPYDDDVIIEDEEPPLANLPPEEEEEIIEDEDVPLANIPTTGDPMTAWLAFFSSVSGMGLAAALGLKKKKED